MTNDHLGGLCERNNVKKVVEFIEKQGIKEEVVNELTKEKIIKCYSHEWEVSKAFGNESGTESSRRCINCGIYEVTTVKYYLEDPSDFDKEVKS